MPGSLPPLVYARKASTPPNCPPDHPGHCWGPAGRTMDPTSDVRSVEPPPMADPDDGHRPLTLLTGGSGYIGGQLLLQAQGVRLRCLARSPETLRPWVQPGTEIAQGDVLNPPALERALHGVHTAYYLVHRLSGSKDFEKGDRQAALNF